ncbi:MAG: thiamine pyrophosphate-binding protein [Actinomycetia bacterium]|nr:thiamine pyrophosphate-binding protein [Actinomycetes bacterium]
MTRRGRDVVFECLKDQGIDVLFGNPGTTELPLMDGLAAHPEIRYILALHEDVAVAAAMGWAVGTGRPGVVNLHVAPGLAHGLGNVYNAWRSRIPLVVTAGQHERRYVHQEPVLWGDLVAMARPVTKWSGEPSSPEELAVLLPRALKVARTPPEGPVFLALPHDVLWAETAVRPGSVTALPAWGPGDADARAAFVRTLAAARRPLVVAGDAVSRADAVDALVAFAEAAGTAVVNEPLPAAMNFPTTHPLYAGPLPSGRAALRDAVEDADLLVLVGVVNPAPHAGYYGTRDAWPPGVPVLQLHDDPHEVGKFLPVAVPLLADLRGGLGALAAAWADLGAAGEAAREEHRRFAAARRERWLAERGRRLGRDDRLTPAAAVAALGSVLPADAVVVNEAVSASGMVQDLLDFTRPGAFFGAKGGGLGHSLGAAVGLKLARPDRPVVAVTGDGAALYYPQAVWTAAHHDVPVVFVILNNTSYRILKQNFHALGAPSAAAGVYPAMDLDAPAPDFVALAQALGVAGVRVDRAADVRDAVREALGAGAPRVVEVRVTKDL